MALPDSKLPPQSVPSDGPPPARAWADKDPIAAARLAAARAALAELGQELSVPVENLISPDAVRRVLWSPPGDDEASLGAALTALGARPWQVQLAAPILTRSLDAQPGKAGCRRPRLLLTSSMSAGAHSTQ